MFARSSVATLFKIILVCFGLWSFSLFSQAHMYVYRHAWIIACFLPKGKNALCALWHLLYVHMASRRGADGISLETIHNQLPALALRANISEFRPFSFYS